MDAAAKAQFISEYGFDPEENPDAAKQVFLYGKTDETFTFSDNPRGDSEVIGQVQGQEDEYSTGTEFNLEEFVDQTNEDGTWKFDVPYAKMIKMAQDAYDSGSSASSIAAMLDNVTGGGSSVILPGSNVSLVDSIVQGILDGAGNEKADDVEDDPIVPIVEDPIVPIVEDPIVEDPIVEDPIVEDVPPELPPPTNVPPEILPGGGDPPVLPGDGMMSGGDYTPQCGELFAYTTLTPYQKKALAPHVDYIKKGRGMLS